MAATNGEHVLIGYMETGDFANALGLFSASQDDFDLWFKRRMADCTGVDLNNPPAMTLPQMLSHYSARDLLEDREAPAGGRRGDLITIVASPKTSSGAVAIAVRATERPAVDRLRYANSESEVKRAKAPACLQRVPSGCELSTWVYLNQLRGC